MTRNDAPHVTGGVNTRLVILPTLSPYTHVTAPIILSWRFSSSHTRDLGFGFLQHSFWTHQTAACITPGYCRYQFTWRDIREVKHLRDKHHMRHVMQGIRICVTRDMWGMGWGFAWHMWHVRHEMRRENMWRCDVWHERRAGRVRWEQSPPLFCKLCCTAFCKDTAQSEMKAVHCVILVTHYTLHFHAHTHAHCAPS